MITPIGIKSLHPVNVDKIVRRLDEFPELIEALRGGDLLTGRMFCAQLFDFDVCHSLRASEQQTARPPLIH